MRTLATLLGLLLFSSPALAKGPGGPDPDPLKDRQHAEPAESPQAPSPRTGGARRIVKKRTVRVKRTTIAPAPAQARPKPLPVQKTKKHPPPK